MRIGDKNRDGPARFRTPTTLTLGTNIISSRRVLTTGRTPRLP